MWNVHRAQPQTGQRDATQGEACGIGLCGDFFLILVLPLFLNSNDGAAAHERRSLKGISLLRAVGTRGTGQFAPGPAPRTVRKVRATRTSLSGVPYVPRAVAPQVTRRRAGSQHRLPARHAAGGLQHRGGAGGATAKAEDGWVVGGTSLGSGAEGGRLRAPAVRAAEGVGSSWN